MKPYLIAEIGINHNGSLEIAKKLIDAAEECRFDSVKFQKREIELVYSKEILNSHRDSPWGKTQRDQKNGLEFGEDEYREIDKYCKSKKISWFASAWDPKSLVFLEKFDLSFNKIASAMIVDKKFLNQVSKQKKHTFISTGMSSTKNIDDAVEIFIKNNCSYELMHCVSTYPMKDSDANLMTINALKKRYNCKVGYSGHENGVVVSLAAVGLGISSLERHITLDRTMYGSDQAASLERAGLKNLIETVRKVPIVIGTEDKKLFDVEIEVAKKLRYWS